ncbi:helix-turn-helix transcriptional regulator [Nocardiopsis sp. CNS-639]|uniref:helix-turn-helix domain-containing protein n=1 Tax=Nocardiopsis sp. CNS-639 TaxID=1169153 RepID=UPI0009DBBBCE|nr:helix-turn-helix transcriptional regulator [Nocardiopsis sp. CNS-639]
MPQSPTVRKRRLVRELRRMREEAGMSIEEARHALGWTSGRLNHMEAGRSRPDSSALKDLMTTYGVTDTARREAILELGRQSKQKDWFRKYDDVLPDDFIGFEAEASKISTFQPIVMPGLLQVPAYAALSARASLARTEDEIERIVAVRVRRQEILQRADAPELHAVITEEALLRLHHSDPRLAREQIGHLVKVAEALNSVTIQVHPLAAGIFASTSGAFTILDYTDDMDAPLVYIDTVQTGAYLEDADQVTEYKTTFDHVSMDALSKAASIDLMKTIIN